MKSQTGNSAHPIQKYTDSQFGKTVQMVGHCHEIYSARTCAGNTERNTAVPFIRDCSNPDMTLKKDYNFPERLD